MNETHDPRRASWVASAQGHPDFPIQNLPYGVFRRHKASGPPTVGVAIGDQILDLGGTAETGVLSGLAAETARAGASPSLNPLMALGPDNWSALRLQLSAFLAADSPAYQANPRLAERLLVPVTDAELFLPAQVGDYTDFYASVHHATNVGSMFRPDSPLLPNYKWVPIGYHGRASSIVASGASVRRPAGQLKDPNAESPVFAPSRALDYEMEVGCFVGPGNRLGVPVRITEAERHLFGLCLVNDWSARDIQTWEYQPLGPFLSKNFATTVSPWVVTLEALEPFRVPAFERPSNDPAPLPYLDSPENRRRGGIDVTLEVSIRTARMRDANLAAHQLSRSRMADLYWTIAQMFTHHASNGCNLQPGDLFASGTISGPSRDARGCLLELTMRGSEPVTLPTGEIRKFLEDGDEVIMRGYCERPGTTRIGFGECRGVVIAG
ncbi:MAG TPA: fumarylacetoacetase [Gemmatimonadales bacterium]|nr:fumarylacetoacetase [Gemmatimonadales bacterium]